VGRRTNPTTNKNLILLGKIKYMDPTMLMESIARNFL